MTKRTTLGITVITLALGLAAITTPARAQELTKVKIGRLAFPSIVTMMIDVVKDQGIDRKNGIDLEAPSFGQIAPFYAALATGEVNMSVAGPHNLQKMRNEGVPIKGVFTFARLNALTLISRDPSVKTFADLKGKTVAADMGSSEYQVMAIYGRTQGVVFGKDVTVIQAGPPLVRSQLQAGRVEAGMTWEPSATLTLRDNPEYRVIWNGDVGWKGISKTSGWQLVMTMREDFLKTNATAVPKLLKMFQDGAKFMKSNPDDADRVVAGTVKLPLGVFKDAIVSGRLVYDVMPAWDERAALQEMFKVAVDSGYLPKLPDEGAIYKP